MTQTLDWIIEDTFGRRMLLVRHQLKMSADEMAELLNVNRNSILGWERGSSPKNMNEIALVLSRELGVNPHWLMWGDDPVGQAGIEPATERLQAFEKSLLSLVSA